jgi:2-dehydro-3-deoxyphosphooctonate aldolase (KDO 8-P synthase)
MKVYDKIQSCEKFFLISGPCVLESEDTVFTVAHFLKEYALKNDLLLIFKSSYRKANRSSLGSPTGPGLSAGLELLDKVKTKFDLPILTDLHETGEISEVAEVADVIQIPAFLSRQTDLIIKAAETGKIINIKKGQFMAPEDMGSAAAKVTSTGNRQVLLTERGTTFGYHDLVVDFRSFGAMSNFGFPVVFDVTHSLQKPASGKETGGVPHYAGQLAPAALATGMVSGLFIETHPQPERALSDSSTQLKLQELPEILDLCIRIESARKRGNYEKY